MLRASRPRGLIAPRLSEATLRPEPPDRTLDWPTDLGQALYQLADLRVWLDGLRDDLGRITAAVRDETELRDRVAHLADGRAG